MATKLNIPIKQSGSTLSANEFNAVVVAINENADSLDSTYEEINKKLGKTTIVIDSNTSVTINTIEDLIEYLHKYGTSTPTYNTPPLIKINQSTYVYKKGQDLKFDIELYDSEGGFLTLVGENPSISGGYSSFIIENLRSGINTIDLNQLVYNNTTSKLDVGNYIFSNIYVIDGLGRSSVAPVNIKIIIGSIELVSSFDSTISYEKNKAISVRYGVSSIVNEMKLTYTITGKMLIENESGEFEYLSYSETSEVNDSFKATSNDEDFTTGTFYYHNYILPEPFTNVGDYNLTIIAEGKGDGLGQTSNILNINIVVNEPGVLYSSSNFDANGLYYAGDSLIIPVNIFYSQIDGVSYMYQCEAWIEGLDITGQSAITSSTKGIELKLTLPDDADLYTIKYKTNIIAPADEVYKTNINYVVLQAKSKSAYQVINDSSSKLELYLTAKGKSNSQPNWLTWNNRYNLDQKYFGSLYNFASVVNGWEDKSETSQHIGDALFCSGDAYVVVNYLPFDKYDDNKYGLTLDFSIREGDLLSENNYNLSIGRPESYPQKGIYLKNNYLHIWGLNSNIKIPIICDDKVLTKLGEWETGDEYAHITITFNYTTKEVFVYINGIISSYGTYSDPGSITHDNPIVINGYIASNGLIAGKSDTKIRFFRVYKSCLNEEQVLSNYIASYPGDIERSLLESLNDTVTPILSTAYLRGDRTGMLKDEMRRLFFSFNSGNESIVADTYIPDPQAVGQYSQAYMDMKKEFPGDFDLQGNSSLSYPVKNYGIDIFDGEAWDVSKSINSKEYNMVFNEDKVVQYRPWPDWDSYHLKANYIDSSHCNNLIMAKLSEIVFRLPYNWTESNAYIESFPSLNSNVQPFKNFTVTRPSNVTDPYSRFPVYPMRVAVDGFPFVLKGDYTDSNGKNFEKEFIGLYTWNMKQHRKLYSMPKPSGDLNRRYFIYRCESNGDSVHEQLRSGYCKFKDMSKEPLFLDSYGRNLSLTYIESQENNEMFAKYNQFDYNWFPIDSELGYLQTNGLYTWIKFASSKDDTNLSNSYTGKVYIGISYDNNSEIKSNNQIDYKWINIDIVEGIERANGEYILIRYATSELGEDMTLSPTGMSYIGIKYNGIKDKWVEGVDYFDKTLDPEELEWRPGAELIMDWECREPDDVGVGHWEEQVNGEWIRTENIINPKDLDKKSLLPDKILRFVWDKLNPDGTADRKGNDLMDYWPSIVDDSIQIPTLSNPNQTFSAINKQKAKLAKQQHVDFLNAISWMSNASDEAFSDPKIFEKYFDLRNCLDYILCCLTFCLTDSIGRNLTMIAYDQESTLSSGGVMDRKPMRFYPVFYDIDTAFGTNVQGGLYSTPYIEWPYDITGLYTAKEGAGQEYNCFGTLFLKRISKCYPKALSRRYQELRSGTVDPLDSKTKLSAPFDYLSILQMYTKQMVGRIGERYFNEDAIYKYIGFENDPDAVAKRNYITNARGNKVMFMKSFLKKRMDYIDSLMGYIPDTEDMAYFQHYSRGQLTLTIETLVAGYIRISFAQNQSISVYVDGKNPTTVSYNYSDVTQHILRIYNCGIITKLNGLQNKDVRIARLNSMTNLQILDLKGNPNFGMEVSTLEISECKGLKTIDLTGCNGSNVFTPDLSGCVLLEEFLVSNSSVGNCSFSTNLNIKTINISNCPNFTSLSVNGLYKLNNLIYDEYRLVSLDISNSGIIIDFSQDNTYNNLLSLTIVANTNISELRFGNNSFNSLQQLNISNCTKLTSVIDLFKNRTGYPNLNRNFLANCTSLTTVEGLFENSILTTLPNQMFFNSNKIQSLKRCFKNCNYLITIPSGILDSMPELVDITEIFYGSKLQRYEDITDLDENGDERIIGKRVLNVFQSDNVFYNCPKLKKATNAFANAELINMPKNMFNGSPLLQNIDYCFSNIINDLSIWEGIKQKLIVSETLFVSSNTITSAIGVFKNSYINNVSDNIFSNFTKLLNASSIFEGSSLTQLPLNCFKNSVLLTNLELSFAIPTINTIPVGFLSIMPALNNLLNIFKNSDITQLPDGFLKTTNITKFKFADLGITNLSIINFDIMSNNTLTDISNLYSDTKITTSPNNLFSTNSNISVITNLLVNSILTSIGSNFLLDNKVTTTASLFANMTTNLSIGDNFMLNSLELINSDSMFSGNTGLNSIGINFMSNCVKLNKLSDNIFFGCTNLTSFIIPNTITSIGYQSFKNSGITSIDIPNSILTIGEGCFAGCVNLISVVNLGNITNIPKNTFTGCVKLSSINISDKITTLSDYSFSDCTQLSTIDILKNITTIGKYAFLNCTSLNELIIPTKITSIGDGAFYGSGLTSITFISLIPLSLGIDVFYDVNNLFKIYVPEYALSIYKTSTNWTTYELIINPMSYTFNVQTAGTLLTLVDIFGKYSVPKLILTGNINGDDIFYIRDMVNNGILTTLDLSGVNIVAGGSAYYGTNVTANNKITPYMFHQLTKLTTIILPTSVTDIEEFAFKNSGITSINIPSNVKTLGEQAINNCQNLISLTLNEGLISIGLASLAFLPLLNQTLIIPNSVTNIGNFCFNGTGLKKLTFGTGITNIPTNCCDSCINLTEVKFLGEIISLQYQCFFNCSSLLAIDIPKTVTFIGDKSFNGCTKLTNVTIRIINMISIGTNMFSTNSMAKMYVPNTKLTAYKTATNWKTYATYMEAFIVFEDTEVERLCLSNFDTNNDKIITLTEASAVNNLNGIFTGNTIIKTFNELQYFTAVADNTILFSGCTSLTNIILPPLITIINTDAFNGCSNLTTVNIPSGVTDIQDRAFNGCISLINITIPNSVTKIGINAFNGCSLESITIPSGVTSIGNGAFTDNNFSTITIPDSVTSLGGAFNNCYSLTSCKLPANITTISDNLFQNDSSLVIIDVPSGVTSIGNNVFQNCTALVSYTFNSVVPPTLGTNVFNNINVTAKFYVPVEAINTYKAATGWKDHLSKFHPIGEITLSTPGTLSTLVSLDALTRKSLVIIGALNGDDIACIRNMSINGLLEVLDLSQATIIAGGGAYYGSSVTTTNVVGDSMFRDTKLKVVNLPTNITYIGTQAFLNCYSLVTVSIPNTVTVIKNEAFMGCHVLNSFAFPSDITFIDNSVLYDCYLLTAITIPSKVTGMDRQCFKNTAITTIKMLPVNPPTFEVGYTLDGMSNLAVIKVPLISYGSYSAAAGWVDFKSKMVAGNISFVSASTKAECVRIFDKNADGELSASEAAIPFQIYSYFRPNLNIYEFDEFVYFRGATSAYADFRGCTNLKCITIPNTITYIASNFFESCVNLTSIKFEDGGTANLKIQGNFVDSSPLVTQLVLPARLTEYGASFNFNSPNLTTIYLKCTTPPLITLRWGDDMKKIDLFVPIGYKAVYQNATNWMNCKSITEYNFTTNPNNV